MRRVVSESLAVSRRALLRGLSTAPLAALLAQTRCGPAPDAAPFAALGTDMEALATARPSCRPTGRDLEGPFHRAGAPVRSALASETEPGERLVIHGRVRGPDCSTPLAAALLDVWQADSSGRYDGQSADFRLRGQLSTDAEGRYAFSTIRPGNYLDGPGFRPAHIHFTITRPGYRALTTQLYFAGDPYLGPRDSCRPCSSEDQSLIVALEPLEWEGVTWQVGRFDVVLERSGSGSA